MKKPDTAPQAERSEDEAAIRALLDRLTEAWGRNDGAAYAAGFTNDATYITFVGTHYRGPEDIGGAHQVLFNSFLKGTHLASESTEIRFYGADTAVVTTRGDTYKGKPGKIGKLQTYTVVRQTDGEWRVAAFQNTQHKPLMEAISFKFQPKSKPLADR
ncbi:MAG: SgcJ/EcaC family oxidoreductase [Thermomicrobiales bacterium]